MPRSPFRARPGAEQRLDADHVSPRQRVADLIGQGQSPEAVRAQARREFGGVEQVKEACRDERPTRWISDTVRDLRIAARAVPCPCLPQPLPSSRCVGRVVRDTAWLVAGGIGVGLVGAVLAALAVLTTIGLAASVLPAWRASRTSPMQALRQA